MDPRFTPVFRVISVAAPAAGAEIAMLSNRSAGWLIRSLRFTLTTSAVVGARCAAVSVSDGTTEYFRTTPGATQAASLAREYCGYSGSSGTASSGPNIGIGFPTDGIWLPQGHVLATVTDNIDAGDQYSAIVAGVFEFPIGQGISMWPFVATWTESDD